MTQHTGRVPFPAQPQQAVVRTLRTHGRVDVGEVAAELGVTHETVRKDLIALERGGLLRRVHGGAAPNEHLTFEPAVATRVGLVEEKQRIAKAAFGHVPAEGSVLLDSGAKPPLAEISSTDRPLIVFTNPLPTALTLLARSNLCVHTLGGHVGTVTSAAVGHWANRTQSEFNVDVAFLGTNGLSLDPGLSTSDPGEAATKRLRVWQARRRIVLADQSKSGG